MRALLFTLATCCLLLVMGIFEARAAPLHLAEIVTLTSPADGVRLQAVLRLPTGPGPFPAAVLLAERGTEDAAAADRLLSNLADHLVSAGVAVLRLQARGLGGSEGSAATTTMAARTADALAALNYLRTRPQIDVTRLGLIGHGEGANVALLAGAQPLAPTFVVAVAATGLSGHELLANQPVMYGKVLGPADTTDVQRPRQGQREQRAAEQEATRMRAKGSNAAQVQTYLDQQRLRLKVALRRDDEARVKHQRAMLEIVRQTPDNAQAQAILGNMLRQRYPAIAPADLQASVRTLTTPAYRNFLTFDPQPSLAAVRCPVLLLQGADDAAVNASVNLPLLKKGLRTNLRVTELRLPVLDHALEASDLATGSPAPAAFSTDANASISTWIAGQK